MTNEIIVDNTRVTEFFILSPMLIAGHIIGKILNEFFEFNEIFPFWLKILRSKRLDYFFTEVFGVAGNL